MKVKKLLIKAIPLTYISKKLAQFIAKDSTVKHLHRKSMASKLEKIKQST